MNINKIVTAPKMPSNCDAYLYRVMTFKTFKYKMKHETWNNYNFMYRGCKLKWHNSQS